MNGIVKVASSSASTMTSIELVEVINEIRRSEAESSRLWVELRHDHFMVKVEKVLGTDAPKFLGTQKYGNNITRQIYNLPKREASLMVMSESYAVQARVYDRMAELESATAISVPTTLSGALRLAAEQAEQIEAQALQLEAAKPAVAFVDKYVDATGLKGFRQVCKLLRAKENQFRDFLKAKSIMYQLGGEWVPHACHLDAGRFEVKAGVSKETEHAFNSARFTAKGVSWIAGEWAKHQLASCGGAA